MHTEAKVRIFSEQLSSSGFDQTFLACGHISFSLLATQHTGSHFLLAWHHHNLHDISTRNTSILFDFRYLVHVWLFWFPVSDFLLACHLHNSCAISTGMISALLTLGTRCTSCYYLGTKCISCFFCSQYLTSAAASTSQRNLQVSIQQRHN